MTRRHTTPVLLTAVFLIAWHGLLLSLPHTHHGPRLETDVQRCSATTPGSSETHLHRVIRELPRSLCLACLVASTHAALSLSRSVPMARAAVPLWPAAPPWEAAGVAGRLPQMRAPPRRA